MAKIKQRRSSIVNITVWVVTGVNFILYFTIATIVNNYKALLICWCS